MRRSLILFILALALVGLACGRQETATPPASIEPTATAGAPAPGQPAPTSRPPAGTDSGATVEPEPKATAPAPEPTARPTQGGIQTEDIPPVPAEYQDLYNTLQDTMSRFQSSLNGSWDGTAGGAIVAAELSPATGNLGAQLLQPNSMDLVREYLDAMQLAGATGATVQISYPMLVPDYPRAAEYLDFYQSVAEEVRRRGMKLLIESSPVFAGTEFSSVSVDYGDTTAESYLAERQQMLVTIARDIAPDFLSITHEPETEIALTGLSLRPDDFVRLVNDTIAAIGPDSGVLLGAGEGSWSNLEIARVFVTETDIDFLNVHVYPVVGPGNDPLANIVTAAELARANGKGVVIGESWLYKANTSDLSQRGVSLGAFYQRDAYSFWQPLDVQFMETLAMIADLYEFQYISFFWSRLFFGYVDYGPVTANVASQQLTRLSNRAAYEGIVNGNLTATGQAISRLSGR